MYILENPDLRINLENLNKIKEEAKNVTIVAATKYISADVMPDLYNAGIKDFGENRVDSFIRKHFILRNYDIKWHFIGHLQRNKAKDVVKDIDVLHSLDSLELAKMIDKLRDKPLDCFVEIKMVGDSNKNGVSPENLDSFLFECSKYSNVNIIGLMAMTEPEMNDMEKKNLFKEVYRIGSEHNLHCFSMGMSDDYMEAIDAGATHIRLGTILYK